MRQAQCRLTIGIEQLHIAQLDGRHPAAGAQRDRADPHRHTQGFGGAAFYRLTPLLDVGQNGPMESQPGDQQQAPDSDEQAAQPACQPSQR
jgi:hypothetical protein